MSVGLQYHDGAGLTHGPLQELRRERMDIAAGLGLAGLGLGAMSVVLGFLGVQAGRRTDRVMASEAEKTRALMDRIHDSTQALIASEADKTRHVITEMRESTQALIASEADKTRHVITEMRESTQALIASEGDKTRTLVTELHESTKTFVATLSAEHAEILKRQAET